MQIDTIEAVENKVMELIKDPRFFDNQKACEFGVELLRWLSTHAQKESNI